MDVFFVFLLLFTEVILLGIAWIVFRGDFISPSVVTLALFILSTACFGYNTSEWDVVFTFKAYILFSLSFILMIITEKFISKYRFVIRGSKKEIKHSEPSMLRCKIRILKPFENILFAFFVFCGIYYIYKVYRSGVVLGATGFLASIGYNKEGGAYDSLSRLLYNVTRMASYVYAILLFNNIFLCKESLKKNIKPLAIVIVTTIMTFFSGQRSTSICYLIGIVVAAGISLYDTRKTDKNINIKKFIKKLVFVALIVVLVFYASSNIVKGTSVQRKFVDYITYYFGSTTALMGKIVENPDLCHTPFAGYFGEKTFNGFWMTMNSWEIVSSVPCERLWIKTGGSVATQAGNEYTFLCGPYIDFGFMGTLIFIIIFYGFFSYLYYWKIRKKIISINRITISAIYIFLYALIAMSFYQDTIRSYSRPINVMYVIYMIAFCKIFLRIKRLKE